MLVEIEELPEDEPKQKVIIEQPPSTLMIDSFEDGDINKYLENGGLLIR